MNKVYFNTYEFRHALNLVNINPIEAAIEFEKYLEKYPNDYSCYPYYIITLINIKNLEKAAELLELVEKLVKNDNNFNNDLKRISKYKNSIIYSKIKLLAYQGKYEECYNLCKENQGLLIKEKHGYDTVTYYLRKKLGLLDLNSHLDDSYYTLNQIKNYSEERFLEHIKKHLANYNIDTDKPNYAIFNNDFKLDKVFEEVKNNIYKEKALYTGMIDDIYIFKYDLNGKENNKMADYFKIITLHNSQDFITMYPIVKGEYLPYTDLNYLKEKEEKNLAKVKRLSQIDKFNKKYGKILDN